VSLVRETASGPNLIIMNEKSHLTQGNLFTFCL